MTRFLTILAALFLGCSLLITSCGGADSAKKEEPLDVEELTKNQPEVHGDMIAAADIELTTPLKSEWVTAGKNTYELKCQSCHRLNGERLVGPGWEGVTRKREPAWIMNMITNVEMMLESDAEAQKLLEQCLVRMPNQNITKEEARELLEYMRHNDGVK